MRREVEAVTQKQGARHHTLPVRRNPLWSQTTELSDPSDFSDGVPSRGTRRIVYWGVFLTLPRVSLTLQRICPVQRIRKAPEKSVMQWLV
jgi:hypothetical protein